MEGDVQFGTQLATQCAVMGYSVPAAITASLLHPERLVVAFAGDGCFLMNGQELATAVKYDTNTKFIVVNNNMYGSIRMHQERQFPERPMATALTNPDFAQLANAYGIPSAVATSNDEFETVFAELAKAKGPALIEIRTDPNVSNPTRYHRRLAEQSKGQVTEAQIHPHTLDFRVLLDPVASSLTTPARLLVAAEG